jgi:acetyltransferase-like isoleucine patch superfamily enzyme
LKYQSIADDVKLGKDVKLADFINLYGCEIGDETKVGPFVEVQKNASIGSRCKIQSHTFICEGVNIGNHCFVGHGVMFINDKYPSATNPDGSMQTDEDWEVVPTYVEDFAVIGSGATILCGVRIGRGSIVGAGSVVTRDIPPDEIWAGNPARFLRKRQGV